MMPIFVIIFLVASILAAFIISRAVSNLKTDIKLLIGLVDLKFDDQEVQRVIIYPKTNSVAGKFIVQELGAVGVPVDDYFLADESIRVKIEEGVRRLGFAVTAEFDGKYLDHLEVRRN